MIVFVDEDMGRSTAYPIALELRGHTVEFLHDAASALERLPVIANFDLVVIDVMLAAGVADHDWLSDRRTNNGLETGLRLLEQLVDADRRFPSRAAFLSAADNGHLVANIERSARSFNIPFWRKSEFPTIDHFCDRVDRHLTLLERA